MVQHVRLWLLVCSIIGSCPAFCQFEMIRQKLDSIGKISLEQPREKIFLHFDKPHYQPKDTIWIKGYMIFASDNSAADSSKIVYLEIRDASGTLVKRTSTYAGLGLFFSNISLDADEFNQGYYTLRAYTNHMRNFGDSLFYEGRFDVVNDRSSEWNIAVSNISLQENHFQLVAKVQPRSGLKYLSQPLKIVLRAKNRALFRLRGSAEADGSFAIDTILTRESSRDTLQLEITTGKDEPIVLPVYPNRDQKIDLQFFPEGGSFIAGKQQKLGFKAIDMFGKPVEVSGKIYDSQQRLITEFFSIHDGMGTLWLNPAADEKYTATIENGTSYELPLPRSSGVQLRILNQPESDSVIVIIDASGDQDHSRLFFRAGARGITCAMGNVHLQGHPSRLAIAKSVFPSGVCRFTLYDSTGAPVNERAMLTWHKDMLKLNLLPQKTVYDTRDSVHIKLTANNSSNEPVIGSFSAAVIDTSLVKYPRFTENIISYMLLSSELAGHIEEPYYYFNDPAPEAVDALMLTQGWVQYDRVFPKQVYAYEKDFVINGNVTNLFNKPIEEAPLTLFGKDGRNISFFREAKTGSDGHFNFTDFPEFLTDSVSFLIKSGNKKGKSFGVGIDVDLPAFPNYTGHTDQFYPQSIRYDTTLKVQQQQQTALANWLQRESGLLDEVVVTAKYRVKGSKNLNKDGGADQVITTKTLDKTPKEDLLHVLAAQVNGFFRGTARHSNNQIYKIGGDIVIFVIDGVNLNDLYEQTNMGTPTGYQNPNAFIEFMDNYLKYLTAEDVAGIEIMRTSKNTVAYENEFDTHSGIAETYSFIEITTYSGNGAFYKKVPGIYLYKPVAPVIAKQFYAPRYTVKDDGSSLPDFRSTVFWKPDIFTNEAGEAEFSFYTSDSRGGYLLIVQGTDLVGGLGAAYVPISLSKTPVMTSP